MTLSTGNAIEVIGLNKFYGKFHALKDVTVSIKRGEVIAVLGPSGSGKSTFLRTLNGLEETQKGEILVHGVSPRTLPQGRLQRQVGMVFQGFNLFPHLSVLENLTLAPRLLGTLGLSERNAISESLLKRVGMLDQADKYPDELSGGQKQRVAIARALVMQPEILLFDEPTSSLDPEMTTEVLQIIKELAHSGITLIIATHEMEFAKEVSDRVFFFADGALLEQTPTQQFFEHPSHERSKKFLRR